MKLTLRRSFGVCLILGVLLMIILILSGCQWPSPYSTSILISSVEEEVQVGKPATDYILSLSTSIIPIKPQPPVRLPPKQHDLVPLKPAASLPNHEKKPEKPRILICLVSCGKERLEESQIALKSAVLFSSSPLKLIVFTELRYFPDFIKMRDSWPKETRNRVLLSLQEVHYPADVDDHVWRSLFRECASIRLFLPSLLPSTESVLYIDTDVMFVSPVESIWHHFLLMNKTQLAAVSPEHEVLSSGWYNRFAKHPYYGKLGINSGVMLMDLEKMRKFGWESYMEPLRQHYQYKLTWGDQDLLNILFHFHPELVLVLDCTYNYRPDHCMYGSVCPAAVKMGAHVLHASRRAAVIDKYPPFREVYNVISQFSFDRDTLVDDLFGEVKSRLGDGTGDRCGSVPSVFTRQMQLYTSLSHL